MEDDDDVPTCTVNINDTLVVEKPVEGGSKGGYMMKRTGRRRAAYADMRERTARMFVRGADGKRPREHQVRAVVRVLGDMEAHRSNKAKGGGRSTSP